MSIIVVVNSLSFRSRSNCSSLSWSQSILLLFLLKLIRQGNHIYRSINRTTNLVEIFLVTYHYVVFFVLHFAGFGEGLGVPSLSAAVTGGLVIQAMAKPTNRQITKFKLSKQIARLVNIF